MPSTPPDALLARRVHDCRLDPARALRDVDEAAAWVRERGVVTITPACALPSLFAACHQPAYREGASGFGSWPRDAYWWPVALGETPGISSLAILRGRRVLVSDAFAAAIDPLCREALAAARASGSPLVEHLAGAGPSLVDDLRIELGLDARALRRVRAPLERVGAVIARSITVPASSGGHRHTAELRLWEPKFPVPGIHVSPAQSRDALVTLGVRAAVVAPEEEVGTWFSWPIGTGAIGRLVDEGRLTRPAPGWVAADGEPPGCG
jgi:hypothetical protein